MNESSSTSTDGIDETVERIVAELNAVEMSAGDWLRFTHGRDVETWTFRTKDGS